ncbi:MAG TPA: ECF-type sigma factor, partial [Polyangiaceae bacterium]|nr:ECF-type sigma factor [Polyangiaceae bacterium]
MSAENNSSAAEPTEFQVGLQGLAELAADEATLERLFSATYEELRKLASSVRRDDPNATFSPTDLVHEAWLKLAA